ncbi:hypothetical protein PVAG01_04631 [Phlyctema vagabunda]|uniref:Uncharacterized protein n=1 Tax=Phlyctema vagabunda TaxID=108571 RepID=A0ABR4PHR8_9HELO
MQRTRSYRKEGFRKTLKINGAKGNLERNNSITDQNKKSASKISLTFFKIWSRNKDVQPGESKPVVNEKNNSVTCIEPAESVVEPVAEDAIVPAGPTETVLPGSPTQEQLPETASEPSKETDQSPDLAVEREEEPAGDCITPADDSTKIEVVDRSPSLIQEIKTPATETENVVGTVIAPENIPLPTTEDDDLDVDSGLNHPEEVVATDLVTPDIKSTNEAPTIDHVDDVTKPDSLEATEKVGEVMDEPSVSPKKVLEIDTAKSGRDSPPQIDLSPKASSFANAAPRSPTEPKPSRRHSIFGRFGSFKAKRNSKRLTTTLPPTKEVSQFMQNLEDEDAKRKAQVQAQAPVAATPTPIPANEKGAPAKATEISGSGFGQDVYF